MTKRLYNQSSIIKLKSNTTFLPTIIEEEESSTLIEATESIISTTSKSETVDLLGGLQPSGGERLIDLLKKIGANTKSKFNGDYIIS